MTKFIATNELANRKYSQSEGGCLTLILIKKSYLLVSYQNYGSIDL